MIKKLIGDKTVAPKRPFPSYQQRGSASVVLGFIVLGVVVAASFWLWSQGSSPDEQEPVACTADAKLCPNGSYVPRVGPNCEFAQCPSAQDGKVPCDSASQDPRYLGPPCVAPAEETESEGWQTYRDEEYGFEVQYPGDWLPLAWNSDDSGLRLLNPDVRKEMVDLGNEDLVHVPEDVSITVLDREQADYILEHNRYDDEYESSDLLLDGRLARRYELNRLEGAGVEVYLHQDRFSIVFGLRDRFNKDVFEAILSTFQFLE